MCSLLQSGLLKGKLLAAWVCTVSYEHRPRDCWGNEISRTCPLRDSTDAVRAGQQYPPAPRAAPLHVRTRGAQPQCERGDRLQTHPEADRRWHRQEVPLDDDQRRQGYPWKFYGLTEEGQTFLDEHNLLAAEETLQQIYETISNKPEKMVKYENALARTTRNPDRISSVSVLNHLLISYSAASSWNSDHSGDGRPGSRRVSRDTGVGHQSRLRVHTSPLARGGRPRRRRRG